MIVAAIGAMILGLLMLTGAVVFGLWFEREQCKREAVRRRARQKMEAFRQSGSERTEMMDIYTWRN